MSRTSKTQVNLGQGPARFVRLAAVTVLSCPAILQRRAMASGGAK